MFWVKHKLNQSVLSAIPIKSQECLHLANNSVWLHMIKIHWYLTEEEKGCCVSVTGRVINYSPTLYPSISLYLFISQHADMSGQDQMLMNALCLSTHSKRSEIQNRALICKTLRKINTKCVCMCKWGNAHRFIIDLFRFRKPGVCITMPSVLLYTSLLLLVYFIAVFPLDFFLATVLWIGNTRGVRGKKKILKNKPFIDDYWWDFWRKKNLFQIFRIRI